MNVHTSFLCLPNRILSYADIILSYAKIVRGECNSKRKNKVFTDLILPTRILSYAKIRIKYCFHIIKR